VQQILIYAQFIEQVKFFNLSSNLLILVQDFVYLLSNLILIQSLILKFLSKGFIFIQLLYLDTPDSFSILLQNFFSIPSILSKIFACISRLNLISFAPFHNPLHLAMRHQV